MHRETVHIKVSQARVLLKREQEDVYQELQEEKPDLAVWEPPCGPWSSWLAFHTLLSHRATRWPVVQNT